MKEIITLPDFVADVTYDGEIDTKNSLEKDLLEKVLFNETLIELLSNNAFLTGKKLTFDRQNNYQSRDSLQLLQNQLAVGQEIIKIHQLLQEDNISNFSYEICNLEPIDNDLVEEESVTIKITASNQPWIINPNPLSDKKEPSKISEPELLNVIKLSQALPQKKTNLASIEKNACSYLLSPQTIKDIESIKYEIEETNLNNNKELSKIVTNQIKESISVESLGDKMKISLYPEALGKVTLECELGEKLKIEISTEKLSTLALLQSHSAELKESLVEKLHETLEADLHFSMEKGDQEREERRNFHYYDLMPLTTEKVQLYLIHNGIVNFIV